MVYIPPTYISTPSHLYRYPGVLQLLKVPVGLSARVLQLLKIPVDLSVHPLMVVGAPGRLAPRPTYLVGCRGIFVPRAIFFDHAPPFWCVTGVFLCLKLSPATASLPFGRQVCDWWR